MFTREQDQLDRHQDDDDVLAVEEDAEHAEHEQDRADGEIMAQADHDPPSNKARSQLRPPRPTPGCMLTHRVLRAAADLVGDVLRAERRSACGG